MSEQMDLVNSILRCPCCDGAVTLCYDPTMVAGQRNWIRCNECGLRSAYHRTCHAAIAAWNKRAGEGELDQRILKAAKRNHIWLNAFACINPSVEFRLGLADDILGMLDRDDLLPTDDSPIGRLTKMLYLSINKS